MPNKTYIYCGSNDMSIMKLCLSTVLLSQFEMVTLLLYLDVGNFCEFEIW